MKEVLYEKIKYLLEYKLNITNEQDKGYRELLERLIYRFLIRMEEEYNHYDSNTKYFNLLLNRLNKNIKSIIIPADTFNYHPYGFLELKVSLKEEQNRYLENKVEITKEVKGEILEQIYNYQFLKVIKNNQDYSGFNGLKNQKYQYIEESLKELAAIELSSASKFYKKEYNVIYPDGTNYSYYMYTKSFTFKHLMSINVIKIFETVYDKKTLHDASLNSNIDKLEQFNLEYDHLFENLKNKNNPYTFLIILEETLKRMENEKNMYKKCEYYKNILNYLIDAFNYKVTKTLNSKDDESIKKLLDDIRRIEENILYNSDARLNNNLEYIKTIKNIKIKISNYMQNNNENKEKEYTIYSKDKKKKRTVKSSVQPINIDDKYVLIHISEIKNIGNKILIKLNIGISDFESIADKIYSDMYITVKEIKHLFSSTELGVFTRESEVIRTALANRIVNPNIMDIIRKERNNFIGEFIYSKEENRCIIYKNKSIEEMLKKVM